MKFKNTILLQLLNLLKIIFKNIFIDKYLAPRS